MTKKKKSKTVEKGLPARTTFPPPARMPNPPSPTMTRRRARAACRMTVRKTCLPARVDAHGTEGRAKPEGLCGDREIVS
ncbi:hypothetical protein J2S28_004724 [Rhizobium sp. SLBN-94]|nr:hypothetical protein [Rhizobium sp. SLBN-94]